MFGKRKNEEKEPEVPEPQPETTEVIETETPEEDEAKEEKQAEAPKKPVAAAKSITVSFTEEELTTVVKALDANENTQLYYKLGEGQANHNLIEKLIPFLPKEK